MRTIPLVTAFAAAAIVSVHLPSAQADELRVLSSVGIQAVLEELVPEFERSKGHEVTLVFDLASALKTKIEGGEAFDVAILTPPLLDDLIGKGLITAETRTVLARVGLGLMIRAGASKPAGSSSADAAPERRSASAADPARPRRRMGRGSTSILERHKHAARARTAPRPCLSRGDS